MKTKIKNVFDCEESVWSWVTELLVFGVVPLVILALNIRVINETRRLTSQLTHSDVIAPFHFL